MSRYAMQLVASRFPAWRRSIEEQYGTVTDFREMCDDYDEIVHALAYWTTCSFDRSYDPSGSERVLPTQARLRARKISNDYLEALIELELEILQYLRRTT